MILSSQASIRYSVRYGWRLTHPTKSRSLNSHSLIADRLIADRLLITDIITFVD